MSFQTIKVPKELYERLKRIAKEAEKPLYKVIENAMENKLVEVGSSVEQQISLASELAKQLQEKGVFDIKLRAIKVTDIRETQNGFRVDAYAVLDVPEDLRPMVREMLERLV